jgi:hypothetical protein
VFKIGRIQIGTIARRAPSGEFLPATPIYRDEPENTLQEAEYLPLDKLTEIFAEKIAEARRKKNT